MKVKTAILRAATNRVLDSLEEIGKNEVDLPVDFYWFIPKEAAYDPYVEPSQFTLGQLSSDYEELQRLSESDAAAVPYALVWLSAIMRAVGEEVVA